MPQRPPPEPDLSREPDTHREPGTSGEPGAGTRISEYVLESLLGEGAFGRVWRARHAVLEDKVVAIKLLRDREFVEFLRREGVLQHRLDHPCVVKVLGLDLEAEHPYLIQEHIEGEDLRRVIDREGKLESKRALEIVIQVAEVLRYAHERGVVHRDLKPANVLLDRDGGAHVVDFGLGKSLEQASSSRLRLSLGPAISSLHDLAAGGGSAVLGTWEYMAPEQKEAALAKASAKAGSAEGGAAEGSSAGAVVDGRADLYALGVMLYEMLTGARPAGRVSLAGVAPELDTVFARCYTSLEERYPDAEALLADLRVVESGSGHRKSGRPVEGIAVAGAASSPLRPGALAETEPSASGERRPPKLLRFLFLLPFLALPVVAFFLLAPRSSTSPVSTTSSAPPFATRETERPEIFAQDDEAIRLNELRHQIELHPDALEEGIERLSGFIATARESVLVERALAWKKALLGAREERSYAVRLGRYRIDQNVYGQQVYAWTEPGDPDVYVRVLRTRDEETSVVFDGGDRVVAGWAGVMPAPDDEAESHFRFDWKSGDGIAIELWDQDVFGDNLLARRESSDALAILLLCGPGLSPEGHVVEVVCDFGLGLSN